jgi:hypothetical protein
VFHLVRPGRRVNDASISGTNEGGMMEGTCKIELSFRTCMTCPFGLVCFREPSSIISMTVPSASFSTFNTVAVWAFTWCCGKSINYEHKGKATQSVVTWDMKLRRFPDAIVSRLAAKWRP